LESKDLNFSRVPKKWAASCAAIRSW